MDRDSLKIEFRAVPYAAESKVLEYRISPEQDLTYYSVVNLLWGLIKFKRKRKYNTAWKRLRVFECGLTSHYYCVDDDFNWMPIWCNNQETLNWYKRTFETFGAFERYVTDKEKREMEKYWVKRTKYLEDMKKILY